MRDPRTGPKALPGPVSGWDRGGMRRLLVLLALLPALVVASVAAPASAAEPPAGWVAKSTASFDVWVPTAQWKAVQDKSSVTVTSPKGDLATSFAAAFGLPVKYSAAEIMKEIFDDGGIDAQKLASYKITKTYPLDKSTPGVERLVVDWIGVRVKGKVPVRGQVIVDVFQDSGAWALDAYTFAAPTRTWKKSIGTLYTIGEHISYRG